MLSSLICISLVATAIDAANPLNNRAIKLSSPQRKPSNTQYLPKENQILDTAHATRANATKSNTIRATATVAMKSEVAKANDVIIRQEHNLLGVTMSIVTRLMEIKCLALSELTWEIISRLFAAAMSVIFGPNANILWPEFVHIAVPFLKLLTI